MVAIVGGSELGELGTLKEVVVGKVLCSGSVRGLSAIERSEAHVIVLWSVISPGAHRVIAAPREAALLLLHMM